MLRPLQKTLITHPNARSLVEVASRVNNLNAIPHPPNKRFGPKFTRTWRAFDINKRNLGTKPDMWREDFHRSTSLDTFRAISQAFSMAAEESETVPQ